MSRATSLSEVTFEPLGLTKRGLFSWCGKLVGHYPVAGWLRLQCSFLKRMGCSGSWDAPVGKTVSNLASELMARVQQDPNGVVTVWTDASSVGIGVVLEVDGRVVEDASWLRKEADHSHINVAELEAVGRGVNLAIAWGFKTFTLAIDSLTVVN